MSGLRPLMSAGHLPLWPTDIPYFWYTEVPQFAILSQQDAEKSVFVAIKISKYPDCVINSLEAVVEVGVAVFCRQASRVGPDQQESLEGDQSTPAPPCRRLDAFVRQTHIQNYSFRVKGTQQTPQLIEHQESLRFCEAVWVDKTEIASAMCDLLASIRGQFGSSNGNPPTMVLVGFSMETEKFFLQDSLKKCIPDNYFSSWADLRMIVNRMNSERHRKEHMVLMQDALSFLGIHGGLMCRRGQKLVSCAGTDAVRTLAVLVHLLHSNGKTNRKTLVFSRLKELSPRHVQRRLKHKKSAARFVKYHPFAVYLRLDTPVPLSNVVHNKEELQSLFQHFNPISACMKSGAMGGWICLKSEEMRTQFLLDVNGSDRCGRKWRAKATSSPIGLLPICEDSDTEMQDVQAEDLDSEPQQNEGQNEEQNEEMKCRAIAEIMRSMNALSFGSHAMSTDVDMELK